MAARIANSTSSPTDTNKKRHLSSASVGLLLPVLLGLAILSLLAAPACGAGVVSRVQERGERQERRRTTAPRQQRVVDLSHPLGPNTLFWPGFPPFNLTHLVKGKTEAGFWLEANWVSVSEHGGTHIDAPAHFAEGAEHLEDLPVESYFGPGVVVDATEKAAVDPDYELGAQELREWERENGRMPPQAVVLVNFGWSSRYPDKFRFFNTRTPDDPHTFHFPGVGLDALKWLVQERNAKVIGVDVPSIDFAQGQYFAGHQFLCTNRIPFVESLTNLDQLPPQGMTVYAVPLRVVGGSGFPVRAFALLNAGGRILAGNMSYWLGLALAMVSVRRLIL